MSELLGEDGNPGERKAGVQRAAVAQDHLGPVLLKLCFPGEIRNSDFFFFNLFSEFINVCD